MGSNSGSVSFSQVVVEIVKETSYKIIDFYHKSYLEGGPTLQQMVYLYEELQQIKSREIEFQAAVHGAKFDKPLRQEAVADSGIPVFRDPAEYDKMSEEERERENQRLMAYTKQWVEQGLPGDKRRPWKVER